MAVNRERAIGGRRGGVTAAAIGAGLAMLATAAGAVGAPLVWSATPTLSYSTTSSSVMQRQPPPDSCHSLGSGLYSRPDPGCTPGALNPAVTPATLARTICRSGWTETVRPSESITEPEKRASMSAYGDRLPLGSYEYDHFIPLELGGATNDPRNLWPEPGASPNPKDQVENELNAEVCSGRISLAQAQHEIASNWTALARPESGTPPRSGGTPQPGAPAKCTATTQYSSQYDDYDVYVHSNQPDRLVTVTAGGASASWQTDSSGYADVYLHAAESAAGEPVTVRAGSATCTTTL
jgi:hypothetical protein